MSPNAAVECSFPKCCRQIYLSTPNIRAVKNISLTSCYNIEEGKRQIQIYYNKNESLSTFYTKSCCGGLVYVVLDSHGGSKPSVETTTTSLTELTTDRTTPILDIPPDGTVSLTIIILLVSLGLFTLIGVGAFLLRHIRKLNSTEKQQFPARTDEYSTIEESQITEIPVYRSTTPVSNNYFVLEKGQGSRDNASPNTNTQPNCKQNTPSNYFTLEHNTIVNDEVSHYAEARDDVYQTVGEHNASSGVVTDDYSHFSDFNGVYNHLTR